MKIVFAEKDDHQNVLNWLFITTYLLANSFSLKNSHENVFKIWFPEKWKTIRRKNTLSSSLPLSSLILSLGWCHSYWWRLFWFSIRILYPSPFVCFFVQCSCFHQSILLQRLKNRTGHYRFWLLRFVETKFPWLLISREGKKAVVTGRNKMRQLDPRECRDFQNFPKVKSNEIVEWTKQWGETQEGYREMFEFFF